MQPPWKLLVEDLGRIARAEIEARPLLLFVGGNNTGKTYLASLLWGLLSLTRELPVARGAAYQRCVAWIEERFARREREPTFDLTPEVHADFVQIVNDTLREHGAELARRTFNRSGFELGRIELRDVTLPREISFRWEAGHEQGEPFVSLSARERDGMIWHATGTEDAERRASVIAFLAKEHVADVLGGASDPFASDTVFLRLMGPTFHPGPVFLPASRTGFMLLYRSLARQLVGDALIKTGAARAPAPDLTRPAIDFVDLLVGLRPEEGAYSEEAAFLERAMGGRLALRSGVGLNEVIYEYAEGEPALPMELSSSLVTELAPVVVTLRHVSGYRVLIIEEPEAHLHPRLQRRLAQVIVRLVRKGLFVWITTHSENFCQQINNFMKLGAHPRRAEMQRKHGYEEIDYLEVDDVAGYQFEADAPGGRTTVTEMKKTASGLVIPTFNRELAALTDEAMDLEQPDVEG
ncbi:AAA family ATPase [Sorangium sp. So ce185]|uniref:AAA family ATPase n=1 Tax=Sorangium sp. So ce185 TaxID=3133287 RepID=UPI003F615804